MRDNQTRLQYLYERFIRDEGSPEEVREFWKLFKLEDEESIRESVFALYDERVPEELGKKDWKGAHEQIFSKDQKKPVVSVKPWRYAAASIILLLGISGYLFFNDTNLTQATTQPESATTISHDIAPPASNRATITLAGGKKIFLDSADNGRLALQNNVSLTKTADGKIKYAAGSFDVNQEIAYNTLTNPRGSKVINMTLSDGSRLWLNAGSSVTFPVAFIGKERRVSITGEAYFEVSHDPSKKFTVEANGVMTKVLGTHFNINAYQDEDAIRVTLLEGSVRVSVPDGKFSTIKPGEQVVKTESGELKVNKDVDVDGVIAWKNAMFSFHDTNIKDIMKEVARWYDVDIVFQGDQRDFKGLNFGGSMSRQKNVSELLKRLEATKAVRFEVNGRKINVIKVK